MIPTPTPGTYRNPIIEEALAEGVEVSPFPLDAPLFSSPTFSIPYAEEDGSRAFARFTLRPPKRLRANKKLGRRAGHCCLIEAGSTGTTFTLAVIHPTGGNERLCPMLEDMGVGMMIQVPPEDLTLWVLRIEAAARAGEPEALTLVAGVEIGLFFRQLAGLDALDAPEGRAA